MWRSTFEVGDVYALAEADDSFDVVHAHQVLQHLTDPVAALREMARVCRPGGVIAVRDVDYGAFVTCSRPMPGWTAGSRSTTPWPAATRPSRTPAVGCCPGHTRRGCATSRHHVVLVLRLPGRARVVGHLVGRAGDGVGVRRAGVEYGLATQDELAEIAAAWLRWADADDGWLGMLHGELLIRV